MRIPGQKRRNSLAAPECGVAGAGAGKRKADGANALETYREAQPKRGPSEQGSPSLHRGCGTQPRSSML
eukprot:14111164-Alexandrium_andersonii.AAC.1